MNTFHPTRRTLLAAGGAALLGPLCSAAAEKPPQFMQFSWIAVRPSSEKRLTISRRRRKRSASF